MGADLPTIAVVAVALVVLLLVMRWTFRPSRPRSGRPIDAAESADLGMLDVVAADVPRTEAMRLQAKLDRAGIRASLSTRHDGDLDVLVFRDDAARARELIQ